MTKWKNVLLSDLGDIIGGATPPTKDESNYGGSIPWITPKDLSKYPDRYISKGERNITEKGLKCSSAKLMPAGTVLFTSRAPIGYIAIAGVSVCTNQGFKSIVPNDGADSEFLFYLLKYNKDVIESMGSGTTFKEVSGSTMKNIAVTVPESIDDQKMIAKILSCIDKKIELNNALNDNLAA